MAMRTVRINVDIDSDTNRRVERWAEAEGRSKRRHTEIVMRRLAELADDQPAELLRLGFIGPAAMAQLTRN